jgi:hypothetical protein
MMIFLLLLFVAAQPLPVSATAQETPSERESANLRHTAILKCVREVRQDDAGSLFNAYISLRGDVRTLGGDADDQSQFQKCLQRRGYTVQATPAKAD